ncbi:hypothetical protein J31TS4_22690 [Paenibacillus sp. J31TS4]|nr:hypothetical protein J31TS4_22690 [Paenibacillus sp. J31TS4]
MEPRQNGVGAIRPDMRFSLERPSAAIAERCPHGITASWGTAEPEPPASTPACSFPRLPFRETALRVTGESGTWVRLAGRSDPVFFAYLSGQRDSFCQSTE